MQANPVGGLVTPVTRQERSHSPVPWNSTHCTAAKGDADAEVQSTRQTLSWNPSGAQQESSEQGSDSEEEEEQPDGTATEPQDEADGTHNSCAICKRRAKALHYVLTYIPLLLFDVVLVFDRHAVFELTDIELRVWVFTCNRGIVESRL